MKIPTWKVGCYYDRYKPDLWREYEAHTVDDAAKMFMIDSNIDSEPNEARWFVAQCTNCGDGAILKVEVNAVPQITYEMKVEPLCQTK